MNVWERLLDRFVPVVDEDTSWLDRRDGVGVPEPATRSGHGAGLTTPAAASQRP